MAICRAVLPVLSTALKSHFSSERHWMTLCNITSTLSTEMLVEGRRMLIAVCRGKTDKERSVQ